MIEHEGKGEVVKGNQKLAQVPVEPIVQFLWQDAFFFRYLHVKFLGFLFHLQTIYKIHSKLSAFYISMNEKIKIKMRKFIQSYESQKGVSPVLNNIR